MARRKSLTAEQQAEKFREEAERRRSVGLPSLADAEADVDERIKKNLRDHGA